MRAESSPAARTGAFIAVAVALFCIRLDSFALNLAVPGIADEFGVIASAAQWTLSAYVLVIGCCFIVGGRVGDVVGRRGALLGGTALGAVFTAMVPERTPKAAYDAIPRLGGAQILAASVVVMSVRHRLVVHGRVPPVGSRVPCGGRLP
ncbi:MFS transporter [Streptomyces cyaneochromogenes]|nr:MFS transporter [Streptomyces cyaneochromogenes]